MSQKSLRLAVVAPILATIAVAVLVAADVTGVAWLPSRLSGVLEILLLLALAGALYARYRSAAVPSGFPDLDWFPAVDELTGLANRRGFEAAADRELSRASRYSRECALLLFYVNDLADLRERQGRLVSETALRTFAVALRSSCRSTDIVGRLEDDQFVVLLLEASAEGAIAFQQRLENALGAARAALGFRTSYGSALFPSDGASLPELSAVAEQRMVDALLSAR